jgi:hypothetical protein
MNKLVTLVLLSSSLLASGCRSSMAWPWAKEEVLTRKLSHPNASAVYLLRQRKVTMGLAGYKGYSRIEDHVVLKLLKEKAFDNGDVRVSYGSKGTIVGFQARSISPSGEITEIQPQKVFDDEAKLGKSGVKVRIFTFPGIQVGTTLEYRYAIEYPYVMTYLEGFLTDQFPTEEFVLDVDTAPETPIRMKAYNAADLAKLDQLPSDGMRLVLTANNIRGATKEDYSTPRSTRDPWWALSLMSIVQNGNVFHLNRDWSSAFRGRAESLDAKSDEYFGGWSPVIGDCDCKDAACRVAWAVKYVDTVAPLSSDERWPGKEKLSEVLSVKKGGAADRARILKKTLDALEVESKFAFAAKPTEGFVDEELPQDSEFAYLLVYVPSQPSVADPIWIDPSCQYCTLGQVSSWLTRNEALVLTPRREQLSTKNEYDTKFVKVAAAPEAPGSREYKLELKVDEAGTAKLHVGRTWKGRASQRYRRDTEEWSDKDWTEAHEKAAKSFLSTGKVEQSSRGECDPKTHDCTSNLELGAAGYAVADGDRLIVPLGVLWSPWDDELKTETRKTPVQFDELSRVRHELAIPVPAGYEIDSVPAPVSVSGPLSKVELAVTQEPGAVRIVRELEISAGQIAPEKYDGLYKVMTALRSTKQEAVIFKKRAP